MDNSLETWLDIQPYPMYQISTLGSLRSWHNRGRGRRKTPKILKPSQDQDGYFIVSLYGDQGPKTVKIHHLVLETFVGPRPDGTQGCHNDGDRQNNRLENLRWDTSKGNSDDMIRHGTVLYGEDNPAAKLTERQVKEIRARILDGERQVDLANEFGVTRQLINSIKFRKCWAHVE